MPLVFIEYQAKRLRANIAQVTAEIAGLKEIALQCPLVGDEPDTCHTDVASNYAPI